MKGRFFKKDTPKPWTDVEELNLLMLCKKYGTSDWIALKLEANAWGALLRRSDLEMKEKFETDLSTDLDTYDILLLPDRQPPKKKRRTH